MNEARLLEYLDGELDRKEASDVEFWVNESSENRELLEQIYYTRFIGNCVSVENQVDVDMSFDEILCRIKAKERDSGRESRKSLYRIFIPIAAFLTGVICTIGISLFLFNDTSKYIVATAAGQRAQFVLPDGSRVWLNSLSELTYSTSILSRTRNVDLEGEAYFEVDPNKKKPFIVSNDNVQVRVLGTKFNVRARESENRVVTTLLSGLVAVDIDKDKSEEIILNPGEILEVNTKNNSSTLTQSTTAGDVLLWMDGRLIFRQTSFKEMADCFEKHFDTRFHFQDNSLKEERFTCEFNTDDNITDILSVLEMTNRFDYKIKGKDIYLSAK